MTYREYIYNLCTEANMDDPEEVTMLAKMLASECLEYHSLSVKQEEKLKEIMSAKEYDEWVSKTAKEMFREHIDGMEQSAFKDFVLENFDRVTDLGDNLFALDVSDVFGGNDDDQM